MSTTITLIDLTQSDELITEVQLLDDVIDLVSSEEDTSTDSEDDTSTDSEDDTSTDSAYCAETDTDTVYCPDTDTDTDIERDIDMAVMNTYDTLPIPYTEYPGIWPYLPCKLTGILV